jgi:hypothetical protein
MDELIRYMGSFPFVFWIVLIALIVIGWNASGIENLKKEDDNEEEKDK